MKKNYIIIFIVLLSYSTVIAQSGKGSIAGVVKDLKTGNPVQNVKVIISQTKQQVTTMKKVNSNLITLNQDLIPFVLFIRIIIF